MEHNRIRGGAPAVKDITLVRTVFVFVRMKLEQNICVCNCICICVCICICYRNLVHYNSVEVRLQWWAAAMIGLIVITTDPPPAPHTACVT